MKNATISAPGCAVMGEISRAVQKKRILLVVNLF